MVSKVIHVSLAALAGNSAILFEQPELPTGAPDVVAVSFSGRQSIRRSNLSVAHLRVAHYLYSKRCVSMQVLAADLLLSVSLASRLVSDLAETGYTQTSDNKVKIKRVSAIFGVKKIVAIEAKISDWKCAIDQAVTNSWFASHSYILLPQKRNIHEICEAAKAHGIGVLIFDGKEARSVLNPKPIVIPASYGSWLFNEWVNSAEVLGV